MKTLLNCLLLLVVALACGSDEPGHNYVPKDGYVPTAGVAIKIAVAVWEPIYGEEKIAAEKPYQAALTNGVWTVVGSLPVRAERIVVGGVAIAEIAKADGRVIRVSHGK